MVIAVVVFDLHVSCLFVYQGILESEEELLAKKRKEKAEKDFVTTRRVPDHLSKF